ncbi:hypothetical protein DL93DRAFT_2230407 [Clavulina sp. PMI_390]|nr:hypothetical protein DL93DRAFT_2230407 [Clavulina sp. PMI_390]
MLQLPLPGDPSCEAINLAEPAKILDDLFRSIYPRSPAPKPSSVEHAFALIQAFEKYQITGGAYIEALYDYCFRVSSPIQAWVYSIRLNHAQMRRNSFIAFLARPETLPPYDPQLQYVDAATLLHLVITKQEATVVGRCLVGCWTYNCFCDSHNRSSEYLTDILANPLCVDLMTDESLSKAASSCPSCQEKTTSTKNRPKREGCRQALAALLDAAVTAEQSRSKLKIPASMELILSEPSPSINTMNSRAARLLARPFKVTGHPSPSLLILPSMAKYTRENLTLPDGDIVLKSSNGIDFCVHSAILRFASPMFSDMLVLSPNDQSSNEKDEKIKPIEVAEDSTVLDIILRALYPIPGPIEFSSDVEAVHVLIALEKYQIACWPLADAAAKRVATINPSIRAWALAVMADSAEGRALAARRFICDSTTGLEGNVSELRSIDAWRLVHLTQVKHEARSGARSVVSELMQHTYCTSHRESDFMNRIRERPFDIKFLSEDSLKKTVETTPGFCSYCINVVRDVNSSAERETRRTKLQNLVDRAVRAETRGVPLNAESESAEMPPIP